MPQRATEERAWQTVAGLLAGPERPSEARVTFVLGAYRGQLPPGHLALKVLEKYRAYLRGERSALSDDELAPVYACTDLVRETRIALLQDSLLL